MCVLIDYSLSSSMQMYKYTHGQKNIYINLQQIKIYLVHISIILSRLKRWKHKTKNKIKEK